MAIKTLKLTGSEISMTGLDGYNAHIRNDGTSDVYASARSGIKAGADGVLYIPAGTSAMLSGISGGLYLLGNGSVQIISNDYAESPFKSAVTFGSVTEVVYRAAGSSGLLINPDFRINQRGQAKYTSGYSVDRWYSTGKCSVAPISSGVKLTSTVAASSTTHVFWQNFEFPFPPGKYTLSLKAADVTGVWAARIRTVTAAGDYVDSYYTPRLQAGINSVTVDLPDSEYISAISVSLTKGTQIGDSLTIEWIKLENGSATLFVHPDPATELEKCQRFYQVRSSGDISAADLRPCMRGVPASVTAVEGGFAYNAEL